AVNTVFDLTPHSIITALDLKQPKYRHTAYHGHFGREEFTWEQCNKVEELKAAVGALAS
ncbi:MAG: S-adenosylmethionine synthetase, partial [Glaciecola sp.]